MILYAPIKSEIEAACEHIRRSGEKPIMYLSQENAGKLCSMVIETTPTPVQSENVIEIEGFVGYYTGCIVYVTDEVKDLIVIVPQYKED